MTEEVYSCKQSFIIPFNLAYLKTRVGIAHGRKIMNEQFIRSAFVLGNDAIDRLREKKVILFGVGGVGSFCAEALARIGIGTICLVDPDNVSVSNINRQLIALHSTVGKNKAEVMKERIKDINPAKFSKFMRRFSKDGQN